MSPEIQKMILNANIIKKVKIYLFISKNKKTPLKFYLLTSN
jgi:hypothetical protein